MMSWAVPPLKLAAVPADDPAACIHHYAKGPLWILPVAPLCWTLPTEFTPILVPCVGGLVNGVFIRKKLQNGQQVEVLSTQTTPQRQWLGPRWIYCSPIALGEGL